jgi:RNA polymerase sigma-70 factor, ECF subfamily
MIKAGDNGAQMDEDSRLMLAVKSGDRDAFRTLIDKYKTKIVNFIAHVTTDPASAEDIAQDVFLQVFQSRNRYVPRSRFSTFLYTIARNAAYTFLRRIRNSPVRRNVKDISEFRDPAPGPEEQAVRTYVENSIRQALGTLTADQRTAVILQYYNGLDMTEIAKTMRTSVSAVKSMLYRAREGLSRILDRKTH